MPLRQRPLLRRLALTFAVMLIAAYASAPLVEALTEHAPGPVSLEATHTASCVVLHSPDSCLACHLLTTHGRRPDGAVLPLVVALERAPLAIAASSAEPRAPPRTTHSRAPPTHLA